MAKLTPIGQQWLARRIQEGNLPASAESCLRAWCRKSMDRAVAWLFLGAGMPPDGVEGVCLTMTPLTAIVLNIAYRMPSPTERALAAELGVPVGLLRRFMEHGTVTPALLRRLTKRDPYVTLR